MLYRMVQKKTNAYTVLICTLEFFDHEDPAVCFNLPRKRNFRFFSYSACKLYKILSGKYDSAVTLIISDTQKTRGNDLRLQKSRLKYDMRKFYFTTRVVDIKSLPN